MTSIVVLAAGVIASWIDLRSRRVPNLLTMPLACAGLLLAATGASGLTFTDALFGCVVGLGLMLPLHVLGGTGAGDVKLMAAFGALLGPAGVLGAFIRMAIEHPAINNRFPYAPAVAIGAALVALGL
jgi:prepilin peptidase CpaA